MSHKNIRVVFPIKKILFFLIIPSFMACRDNDNISDIDPDNEIAEQVVKITTKVYDTDFEATDSTVAIQSKNADPDFEKASEDNVVKRIEIAITKDH